MLAGGCEGAARSGAGPRAELVLPKDGAAAYVVSTAAETLVVSVRRDSVAPVAGSYTRAGDRLEFHPRFPLDSGRTYFAQLKLGDATWTALTMPGVSHRPSVTVVRALPSGDSVPENLLRMYLEFSAPMSREPGIDHITLVDDHGKEITHAFLPVDGDFWNPAHTRYTVFFDPGRVKTGIASNEQMGRPLRAGRRFTLVVDSTWRDANGLPMAAPYRRELRVGAPVSKGIVLAEWRIGAPHASTTEPLVVTFPRPLDHGLLQRAIGVERSDGKGVSGSITVAAGETEWRFAPRDPWTAGEYRLVVLAFLEDVAGNRVGRAFEVDNFERVDSAGAPERFTLPFRIAK